MAAEITMGKPLPVQHFPRLAVLFFGRMIVKGHDSDKPA
jgi:hypothetical protein